MARASVASQENFCSLSTHLASLSSSRSDYLIDLETPLPLEMICLLRNWMLGTTISIITIERGHIKVLHASFGYFLSDKDRSKEYYINSKSMFTELAYIGFRHIDQYVRGGRDGECFFGIALLILTGTYLLLRIGRYFVSFLVV